jgi:hypothetical protein
MKWPKALLEANFAFMTEFARKLRASGELAGAEGLAAPTEAKRVYLGKDRKPVTDGVFPEAKEYLAGYWIVDVDRPERAYEIAAEAAHAPGQGEGPLVIEVRRVMQGPPDVA